LSRPKVDGFGVIETNIAGSVRPKDFTLFADYNIEGSDVGYRWNAREGKKALFPFGYGLSYTAFASSGPKVSGLTASFSVANTGKREGAMAAQLYLVSRAGAPKQRLVGYSRVSLAAGASQKVTLTIDPRLLTDWKDGGWAIAAGDYGFVPGEDAETLGPLVRVRMNARRWKD
jgi:beta-glucosidase